MTNLNQYRYTKHQYKVWRNNFLKAIKSAYADKRLTKSDYYKFTKSVNKGLKEYGI